MRLIRNASYSCTRLISRHDAMAKAKTIFRIDLSPKPATSSLPCVVKLASKREITAFQTVQTELPWITSKIIQAIPLEDGAANDEYLLLMEDSSADSGTTLTSQFLTEAEKPKAWSHLGTALKYLAALHRHFRGCAAALKERGLPMALARVAPTSRESNEVIARALKSLPPGIGSGEALRDQCAAVSSRMEYFFARLQDENRHTFVHGDFHFDNVVIDNRRMPVLIDWGAAGVANPCWDLVFCGPNEISVYQSAIGPLSASEVRDFREDHRAAIAARMFCLLEAALAKDSNRLSAIMPPLHIFISNFALAADPDFRGGVGFDSGALSSRSAGKPAATSLQA